MSAALSDIAWLSKKRAFRYVLNGLIATAVHLTDLIFKIQVLNLSSAGISNDVASFFGIATSFLGNRYYVFSTSAVTVSAQLLKFILLYLSIALLHVGILFIWTDQYQLHYLIGFFAATLLQFLLSYWGNKLLVFKV